MVDQKLIFGKSKKCFSLQTLNDFFNADARTDTSFTKSKEYFLTYYAKSLDGHFYVFQPSENDDEGVIIKKDTLNCIFGQIKEVAYFNDDNIPCKFKLRSWFLKEHYQTFSISADPRRERFFTSERTGTNYINLSKGFIYKERKEFKSFKQDTRDKVQFILDHIKNIWNSGNDECYDFTVKWLANALTGRKMKTALYLKSGEGTGKSIIVEFLINHVIGPHLGVITQRASSLMKFNYQLLNKILLCLEELPSCGKYQWFSISDYLKDIITNGTMDIEKKYDDVVQIINMISLIIITNNENSIRFGKDIRRYHMCDISHDKVGDTNYFNKLSSCMTAEVGEALFWYFTELRESSPEFTPDTQTPQSNTKTAMKDSNMTPILQFIKDDYIKFKRGFDKLTPVSGLLEDFKNSKYYQNNAMKIKTFHNFLLADVNIIKTKPATQKKTLHITPVSFEDLLNFYKKKGFWDDRFDEFEEDDNYLFQNNDPLDSITLTEHEKEINKRDEKIKELEEMIKKLQKKEEKKEKKKVTKKKEEKKEKKTVTKKKEEKEEKTPAELEEEIKKRTTENTICKFDILKDL